MQAPIVTPPVTTMGEGSEPVCQYPSKLFVEHEREVQQPIFEDVPEVEARNVPESEAPRRSQRV